MVSDDPFCGDKSGASPSARNNFVTSRTRSMATGFNELEAVSEVSAALQQALISSGLTSTMEERSAHINWPYISTCTDVA